MFENLQFFRICILRFQKVLLLKNINMGIKKRRCLCWFQIRCCRLKQMPIKKLEPKNYAKFEYLFSCLCIFSWFFASDLCGLMISEMTLSNQSHFPRFFSIPESHLTGFCRSYKMTLVIEKKGPLHCNFTGDGKCKERGWACTSHPHQPG